ncbi:hypothetical protein BC828DRAFT_380147 [Blastocladiella britannica]|nr:hypothetical protein BC828DRAFT_380147 [Blastocladiella britannica]
MSPCTCPPSDSSAINGIVPDPFEEIAKEFADTQLLPGDAAVWELRHRLESGETTDVELTDEPLSVLGTRILQCAFQQPRQAVRSVDLVRSVTGLDMAQLSALVSSLPSTVESLSLEGCEIGDGIGAVAAKFPPSLLHLSLVATGNSDFGAQALAPRLPHGLVTLVLADNQIGPAGAQALASRLPVNCGSLETLVLDNNPIGDAGVAALAEITASMHSLQSLSLANTGIGCTGAEVLARHLFSGTSGLMDLSLADNPALGDAGATALAATIDHLATLVALNLTGARISDDGMLSLAPKLPPTLEMLALSRNAIGDAGTAALATHMPPSLVCLHLDDNQVGDVGAVALAFRMPSSLLELQLSRNWVGDVGAVAIAKHLPPSIQELWVNGNRIGPSGIDALIERKAAVSSLELVQIGWQASPLIPSSASEPVEIAPSL